MKKWLTILGFLGAGGAGFGFGYLLGRKSRDKADEKGKVVVPESDDYELGTIRERLADPDDGQNLLVNNVDYDYHVILNEYQGEDEETDIPEMPMDEPVIPDDPLAEDPEEDPDDEEEIPELHPEDLLPHPITEDEFNRNLKGYDISALRYYEEEDAVYDPEYDEFMDNPEQVLGIGWFTLFGPATDNIYIENDTMGTLYSVHYMRGSIEDS